MADENKTDPEVIQNGAPPNADSLVLQATTYVIDGMSFSWEEAKAYRAFKREYGAQAAQDNARGQKALAEQAESEQAIRAAAAAKELPNTPQNAKQAAIQADLADNAALTTLEDTGEINLDRADQVHRLDTVHRGEDSERLDAWSGDEIQELVKTTAEDVERAVGEGTPKVRSMSLTPVHDPESK